jgi:hypothetical protein
MMAPAESPLVRMLGCIGCHSRPVAWVRGQRNDIDHLRLTVDLLGVALHRIQLSEGPDVKHSDQTVSSGSRN